MAAFWVLNNQFQKFIDWQYFLDYDSEMTEKPFAEFTGIKVKQFRETLLLHMGNVKKSLAERTRHKRQYDRRMNERHMQPRKSKVVSIKTLDASLVVTECSGTKSYKHDTRSSSRTYITHVVDANIRPVNDQVPSAEVHLTVPHNVLATEQYQAKSPLLKAELAKTTLIYNSKNQIKSVKEASNEAKVKNDIDVIEAINIKLEHIVAKLLTANEQLHKENEHLKQTYKELYDSIKKTRVHNKDISDSLISQINQKSVENADLKAQIQEKVFANAALKNELRKLKGNSVDTKNSQEEPYGSNDMAHNHYLEEVRKKTQERNRNSKPSVMHTTSLQNTTNGSKPNPRSNNQLSRSLPVSKSSGGMSNGVSLVDHSRNSSSFSDSKHFVCSTCHKCVFNANHDNCITKFLKEVNSRAKVQSPKTRNNNKPVVPKSHTQKPGRQIAIGQRFSPKKSSAVHEKPNTSRSCLRWKPTGRIFKIAGLRWIPTGKMFTDNTTKVDSEPSNGSNDDITNSYECDQTLNVSAGTTNLSADDVCSHQFRPRSSSIDDVCSHQFRPRSSMTNDVCSHQFRPRSSTTNGLVQNLFLQTPYVPPSKKVYEGSRFNQKNLGFFDELLQSSTTWCFLDPVAVLIKCWCYSRAVNPISSTLSTTIDQDVPSASTSPTNQEIQSQVILQGSSEGSGTTPEVPDEPKDNFGSSTVVAEKQARYIQTKLTLSSAELEIQSMVDVPIHQEDLAVQRTPLINLLSQWVTERSASTPTPPHTSSCSYVFNSC
ncbi:hypothetical protein Tco_0934215 [Tanacetum coccineum]